MNQKRHTSPSRRHEQHKPRSTSVQSAAKVAFDGARLFVQEGREKSLLRRHPWVFSSAVERLEGSPVSGDTIQLCDAQGGFLAWAAFNSQSQICSRVWSWQADEKIDSDFFYRKIIVALAARKDLKLAQHSNGMRLIHGESDGLPGLIVDQYADVLVLQLGSAGVERWRDTFADILQELCQPVCIYERSDSDGRALEGLAIRNEILRGALPEALSVTENGIRIAVDVATGQKTGFYLDQRDNRALIGELAEGRDVLNCFCYTGGFSLAALAGGANSVMSVDSSGPALDIARRNLKLNGFDESRAEWLEADVFKQLRTFRDAGRSFDLIVLDPPKFAPTARDAERAARGYKDINLSALRLLRPGGYLATFSCSGGISADLFQKIVAGAAADAGVSCYIEKRFSASNDHPVLMEFPEGEYLKGLLLRRAA
jgi:23S rRNA (cytosine1962-C5)-methyltransferase